MLKANEPTAHKKSPQPSAQPVLQSSPLASQVQQTKGYDQQSALLKPAVRGAHPPAPLGVPGGPGHATADLPETLQELPDGRRVAHGTDAGNFYCEHMFYSTQRAAEEAGSSVVRNGEGESLTGFLHLPGDREATGDTGNAYLRKDSRRDTRAVVGNALRGYIDTALPQAGSGAVRILLTGYGNWGSVVDNPTGAFVASKRNLDAAMLAGFGPDALLGKGVELEKSRGPTDVYTTWSYRVKVDGAEREVQLRGQVFPVADQTIDGGAASVQQAMADFAPHGVLSMGVAVGRDDFLAEHHADDGGLDASGKHHQEGAAPRADMADNYALARAIVAGQQAAR